MKPPRLTLWMVGILGVFFYLPAAQAGGSIVGDSDSLYLNTAISGDFNNDGTPDVVVCSPYSDRATAASEYCIPEDPDDPYDPTDTFAKGSDPDDPECDGVVDSNIGAVHIFTSGVGDDTPLSAADIVIYGGAQGDYFGKSCANAGDFNGDGVEDMVVGASRSDGAGSEAGAAYVIFGSASIGDTVDVGGFNGLKILGANDNDRLGTAVAGVGDVDGDGHPDVLIGAQGTATGSAYLVYGSSNTITLDLGTTFPRRRRYVEYYGDSSSDKVGEIVAGIGDVNGDGLADLAVSARNPSDGDAYAGKVYVILGGPRPSRFRDRLERSATAQFAGEAAYDYAGNAVAGAGDINGDGYDDFLIGAPYNDEGGVSAGAVYLCHGGPADPVDTSLADVQKFLGNAHGTAGLAVAGVGDVNGDGLDDFTVGAPSDGSAYLVFGSADSGAYDPSQVLSAGTSIQEFSTSAYDYLGVFVGPAGDLDGDGTIYFFIGEFYNGEGAPNAGKIYIDTMGYISL